MNAAVPLSSETAQPLSQSQRIINTFGAPSKTFADIRRSASWWLPWLLVSLGATAFLATVDKKVGFDSIVRATLDRGPEFVQKAMEQLSPEQRERAIQRQIAGRRIGSLYLGWAFTLIFGLITAALLMVVFNFGFEAGVPFQKSLAVVFYAWLPKLVFFVLAIIVLLKGVDPQSFDLENPIATNLGFFIDPTTSSRFLYRLLVGIDVFAIWQACLMGIGFAQQSTKKLSTGTAIATVLVLYGLLVLGRAALPF